MLEGRFKENKPTFWRTEEDIDGGVGLYDLQLEGGGVWFVFRK